MAKLGAIARSPLREVVFVKRVGRRPPDRDQWAVEVNGPYACPREEDGHHSYVEVTVSHTASGRLAYRFCSCGATFYVEDFGDARVSGFFWEWVVEDGE